MPANRKHWQGGMTGRDFEQMEDLEVGRIDASWPRDSDGSKLSLPPAYMEIMSRAGPGDIKVTGNAEAVDPPRKKSPRPGSPEFGIRAAGRRERIERARTRAKYSPGIRGEKDVEITDPVSGQKISLRERRLRTERYLAGD